MPFTWLDRPMSTALTLGGNAFVKHCAANVCQCWPPNPACRCRCLNSSSAAAPVSLRGCWPLSPKCWSRQTQTHHRGEVCTQMPGDDRRARPRKMRVADSGPA